VKRLCLKEIHISPDEGQMGSTNITDRSIRASSRDSQINHSQTGSSSTIAKSREHRSGESIINSNSQDSIIGVLPNSGGIICSNGSSSNFIS
jgi:hypothetical protein